MKLFMMLTTLLNMYQVKWTDDYFEVELYEDVTQHFETPSAILYDNEDNIISVDATYLRGVNRTDLSIVNSRHVKSFKIDYRVFFDEYGLSFDHTITFKIVDKIPPVINELDDITILLNSKIPTFKQIVENLDYYDNYYDKEDLTIKIKGLELVNNKIVDNYPIIISIKDQSNNYNYYEIFIKVISYEGPIVKYTSPIVFNYGNIFNYYDYFKITDETSNSFRVDLDLSLIDFTKLGQYKLSLVVTNGNNVSTYIETEFHIVDKEKPKLTISNNQVINVSSCDESILKSFIIDVSDNYNDLSIDDVSIKHQIDFNKIGKYDVYYEVVDESNNVVTKILVVEIKDLEKPTIFLTNMLVVEVFSEIDFYNYFSFSDNYDNCNELEIKFDEKFIDYNVLGYYYLTVEVTDLSKNKIKERFRVQIVDLVSPVVKLVNDIVITDFMSKSEDFYRSHFSISDNYNTYETIKMNYEDNINYDEIGVYEVNFNFIDSSNNLTNLIIDIIIIDNEAPNIKLNTSEITIKIGSNKPNYYSYIEYYNDNYTTKDLLNINIIDYVCYTEVGCYDVIYQLCDSSLNEVKIYLTVYVDLKISNLVSGDNLIIKLNSDYTSGMGLTLSDHVVKVDSFPKVVDTSKAAIIEVIHIAYDARGNSSICNQHIEIVPNNNFSLKKYSLIIIINVASLLYLGYLFYQDKKYINFDNK